MSPRKDKHTMLGLVMLAIIIILAIAVIYLATTLKPAAVVTPTPAPTQYSLTLPTVFTVNDLWKGETMTGVTIYIYKYATKELLESGTVTHTYTTTNPLKSGDRYWVKLVKSNAFKFYDVTIPYESSPSASNHYVTLDFYSLGSYPVKLFSPAGEPINDGGEYDVAGNLYPSFTLMFGPPSDDTGVMDTYDPIKGIQRQVLFVIHVFGTDSNKLIVSNIPLLIAHSSTDRYFGYVVDSSKLVRDLKPDGTYASEGILSLTLSFDASGLSAGDEVTIEVYLYAFTNVDHFKSYGTHPTDYVSITQVTTPPFSFNITRSS